MSPGAVLSMAPGPCSSWVEMEDTKPPGDPHQTLWWEGWAGSVPVGPARVPPRLLCLGSVLRTNRDLGGNLPYVGEAWAEPFQKEPIPSSPLRFLLATASCSPASLQAHEQAAAQLGEEDQPLSSELAPGRCSSAATHLLLLCPHLPGLTLLPFHSLRTSPTSSKPWPATA